MHYHFSLSFARATSLICLGVRISNFSSDLYDFSSLCVNDLIDNSLGLQELLKLLILLSGHAAHDVHRVRAALTHLINRLSEECELIQFKNWGFK